LGPGPHGAAHWRWARSAAPGREATSVVLSLGLGLAVLAAVGQIDAEPARAIQRDLPQVAPSYFFVDIQPDQLAGFLDRVENDPAVSRVDTAPMLRGIITRINGQRARDVAGDHWVIQGDRGVTYSDAPPPGRDHRRRVVARRLCRPAADRFAAEEAMEIGLRRRRDHRQHPGPRHHGRPSPALARWISRPPGSASS
jgi:putative ABC transport system permease protein